MAATCSVTLADLKIPFVDFTSITLTLFCSMLTCFVFASSAPQLVHSLITILVILSSFTRRSNDLIRFLF